MESWTVNFLISWHVLMLVGRLDQREYAEKKGDFKNREELARGYAPHSHTQIQFRAR